MTVPMMAPSEGADAPDELETEAVESPEEEATDPSGQDGGWWLTEPDGKKVRQAVIDLWKSEKASADKRAAKERCNELSRQGVRGVRVVASSERNEFDVRVPFGGEDGAKAPNKADQLIRRVAATLTVDPPAPDVAPTSDSDDERASAELAERILKVEGAPGERDDVGILRNAINLSGTYGSVFTWSRVAPHGGGLVPLKIQAHPAAQTKDDALIITDPATGQQAPADPSTLTERYVTVTGALSDRAADAQMVWQPKVTETLLRPSQVRFVPAVGVTGIEDAPGVLLGHVSTLGEVIARYYDGERPDEETIKKLVGWKPEDIDWKRWVPKAHREQVDRDPAKRPDGTTPDEALVVTLTLYYTSSPYAPLGAHICVGGLPEPITRDAWRKEIGEGDTARMEYLPLPVSQMRCIDDAASGDPYGMALVEDLAPIEEIRAAMIAYLLEYAHQFAEPQEYLPFGTTIQPGQRARRDPIMVEPGQQPFFAPLPPMTPVVTQIYEESSRELNSASGLEEAAQGVSSPDVKSGRHAQQVIEQALVALAGLQQNASKYMTRLWSIRLTLMRAYYSAPRVIDYAGEGGDYQQRAWTGADLMGAGDVTIARGSNTMTPRSVKQEMAEKELGLAVQIGDQTGAMRYYRHLTGNTAPTLGLQDDPSRQRIARQLASWRDGAKKKHEAAPPADPNAPPVVVGVDPSGLPITQPAPAPPDPVAQQAAQIFAPNPTDDLPHVAPIRFTELADAMASRAFIQADPRYQQALAAEYERMRQAAGVMTRAEQMQAQQQQAAMQQQADAQKQQQEHESKREQAREGHAQTLERDAAKSDQQIEAQTAQGQQRMQMQAAAAQMQPNPQAPL